MAETALAQTIRANGATGDVAVYRGATITVDAARSGASRFDWVALYQVGAPHTNRLDWWYMNGAKSAPPTAMSDATFTFAINFDPNAYELRYFANNDYNFLAKSGVVTIQAPRLTINDVAAPQEVTAAPRASVQVHAEGGPAHPGDWVGLYRTGAADAGWLDWATLNGTKTMPSPGVHTATFAMALPMTRGPFELRWFKANTYTRLAMGPVVRSEVTTPVAGGDAHTLIVRPDGSVWASGLNASGQLGTGTTTNSAEPIQVGGLSNVVSVAAGASHSMALTTTGSVYVWGANDLGQVGDGSTTPRTLPTPLSLTNVVAIAAGGDHSLALTSSGEVFAWGRNGSGELGNGTTADSHVPISIASDAVAIAGGERFTLFVKSNGTVWGTGDNEFGALGDGTNTSRTSPGQMSYLSTAVAVRAGKKHSLVLLANGLVNAAGQNHVGQLGDTSVNNRATPAAVSTLTNIVAIGAGQDFSLAVDKDGVAWAWGNNAAGQLGAPTPSYRTTPASIVGLSGIGDIAAGNAHTLVVTTTGAVTTVGLNTTGQLADGTTSNRSTPAQISGGGSDWRVATPTLSVASGTYDNNVTVVVGNATANSIMRYTQNGNEPTESDPTVASGANIVIDRSQTLKIRAWKTGLFSSAIGSAVYELKVGTPLLSPAAGTYSAAASVSASTTTAGAVLRYTLDGSEPTAASAEYTGSILIATTSTLKVAGFKTNWSGSNVGGGLYAMNFGTLAAPTVTPATGTYAGGATVTMSSAQSGAVVRYTVDGSAPDPSSPAYTAPIAITGTGTTVKAKAFHADYTASAETSRIYTLAAAPPTIDPPAGVYTSAQNVTMTAASGPAVTIRYTLDGSEPTASSTAYTAAFAVNSGTTIKARSFPNNGWAASASASAGLTFNFGSLDPPAVSPQGGVYANAQLITLSTLPGASIRYTVDGSEPTAVSNLYVTPLEIASGSMAIKARAFHPDWTESAVSSRDYTIDATVPTITSSRFPAAAAGWHNTPTSVSFNCQDNIGIASCSAPITVSSEGADQQIVGTAVDQAGRQATETVTVSLDATAPTVAITAPTTSLTTSSASIDLEGEVSDSLSGIIAATCNGQTATVVAGLVSCAVPLGPGRNDVVLTARDAAGNVTSKGVRILRVGTATILGITPTAKTLILDETTTLTLTDEFGAVVPAATWSSSDPAIVSVSSDDPPVLTAHQPGSVTITAAKNALSAEASLTVAAATSLSYGTTRWSISGGPGFVVGHTIAANRVELSVPDLFSVESNETATIVRGITASGDVLWTQQSPGTPLMGDSFGGLVAGTVASSWTYHGFVYSAFTRFGGPANVLPWRYDAAGNLARPAQAPDGTIYALERRVISVQSNNVPITDTKLIVLDGSTGAVRARLPIAPNRKGLSCGVNGTWEEPATVWGPIVGDDGYGYLLVGTSTHVRSGPCPHHYSQDQALTLWRIAPTGTTTSTIIFSQHCERPPGQLTTCDAGAATHTGIVGDSQDFLPDGTGGMLVRWRRITSVSGHPLEAPHTWNFSSEARLSRVVGGAVELDTVVDDYERTQMIGGGGTAYVTSPTGSKAMDVSTWTPIWSNPNLALEPVVALANRGVAMHDLNTGILHELDATGASVNSGAFGGRWGYQSALGLWMSADAGELAARLSLPLTEARRSFSLLGSVGTEQNAPRLERRATREDHAAILFLNFVFDMTARSNVEYSGAICREANGQFFYWNRLQIGSTADSPGVEMEPEQCADGATTVAYAHTHPSQHQWSQYPSGYSDPPAYYDVDRNAQNGTQPSDLKISNDLYDDHADPRYRNLTGYLAGRSDGTPRSDGTVTQAGLLVFSRYKKTSQAWAEDNIYRYDVINDTWIKTPNAPW